MHADLRVRGRKSPCLDVPSRLVDGDVGALHLDAATQQQVVKCPSCVSAADVPILAVLFARVPRCRLLLPFVNLRA